MTELINTPDDRELAGWKVVACMEEQEGKDALQDGDDDAFFG
jgi:hypothetical protein